MAKLEELKFEAIVGDQSELITICKNIKVIYSDLAIIGLLVDYQQLPRLQIFSAEMAINVPRIQECLLP